MNNVVTLNQLINVSSLIQENVTKNQQFNELLNDYIEQTSIEIETTEDSEDIQEEQREEIKTQTNYNIPYTAILEIPKISLKRGVVDSTKNFKSINYAISVDNSSQYPNEKGNFILYAHSGNSSIAYFKNLYNVQMNDDVFVYYNGVKYHYIIYEKYNIKKTGKASIIKSKEEKYITLITCDQNKKNEQIVILGKLINEKNY